MDNLISLHLLFLDDIRLVKDGKYGSESPTGAWSGLVGEIVRKVNTHNHKIYL